MVVDDKSPIISYPGDCSLPAESNEIANINGRNYERVVYTTLPRARAQQICSPTVCFLAIGFHAGNVNAPGISATIRGSLNLQVTLDVQCDACLELANLVQKRRLSAKRNLTFSWRYRRIDVQGSPLVSHPSTSDAMRVEDSI